MTLYTIIPKPLLARWSNVLVSGYGMLLGGLTTNLAVRSWTLDFASVSREGWLAMCGVVVTGSLMATTLYLRGVADIGPVKASLLAIAEPVVAAILGMLWLGTRFTRTDLLGFAFIFVTIWLLSVRPRTIGRPGAIPTSTCTRPTRSSAENAEKDRPACPGGAVLLCFPEREKGRRLCLRPFWDPFTAGRNRHRRDSWRNPQWPTPSRRQPSRGPAGSWSRPHTRCRRRP